MSLVDYRDRSNLGFETTLELRGIIYSNGDDECCGRRREQVPNEAAAETGFQEREKCVFLCQGTQVSPSSKM